jgi:cytochrome c biogenesis protein CcmG/thiol:disulfide interchange protein DsbE
VIEIDRKRLNATLAVLLLGGLLIFATRLEPEASAVISQSAPSSAEARPLANHIAPDFALSDLAGEQISLSELRGKVVLVNIWATWCPPCRAELPMIEAAHQRYGEQGFVVLAVNQAEERALVADFMRDHGLSFPVLLDSDAAVSRLYATQALPSSFFIDRQGVIRTLYRGPLTQSVMTGTIEQLLAEGVSDVSAP